MATLTDREALGVISLLYDVICSHNVGGAEAEPAWEFFDSVVSAGRDLFNDLTRAADRQEPPATPIGELTFGQRLMLTAVAAASFTRPAS